MATGNLPAPATSFPFVDKNGFLTTSATQFLQPLYQEVQGLGGALSDESLLSGPLSASSMASASAAVWIPTVIGSATAGTQTYGSQFGLSIDVGPLRVAVFSVTLTGTGGGIAGDATVGGFLLPSNFAAGALQAGWLSQWSHVTLTASYTQLGLQFSAGASGATLMQSGSAQASIALPVGGLSSTTQITGGIAYVR